VLDTPTGRLIRLFRIDRKQSTVKVATLAGITVRDLEMIEAGTRSASLPVLRKIAKMLGVRTSTLIGAAPSEDHEGPINPLLAELERALLTYRTLALSDPAEVPELGELAALVEASWDAWFTSPNKYRDVLRVLPGLIVHSERAVHEQGRSPQACRLACEVYQLARPVVKYLGRIDLSARVADRGMRYAEETEDPVVVGAATWNLALALLADDMPHGALDIATWGAEQLERLLPDGTPEHLSLYGGLVQVAAVAQVRTGEPRRGRELLGDARQAAERVGEGSDHHHIFFGPTNVGIHATSIELEAGEISEGLRLADNVDIARIGSLERKTAHLYQVASAYEYQGNDPAVFAHLTMAERICPEDFRYRQTVRNMVRTLVRRARSSYAAEVREFAARIGMLD
jgi:transcriptional regulator with XRE-family HTH domain